MHENPAGSVPIVCVNYKSDDATYKYTLAHASKASPVLIVDNSPLPSKLLEVLHNGESIYYFFTGENIGYLNALGLGVEKAKNLFSAFDFIILSNVDLEFDSKGVVSYLLRFREDLNKEGIGIIGPNIYSELTGLNQNPFIVKRPRRLKLFLIRNLAFLPLTARLWNAASELKKKMLVIFKTKRSTTSLKPYVSTYSVHGAFIVVSSSFVKSIDKIRWPCFLYGEELWFAEMARRHNYTAIIANHININHQEHITTGAIDLSKRITWQRESMDYILKEFFGA